MAKFVPLSRQTHSTKKWNRPQTYEFAAKQPVIPIVSLELATAAVNMPLGFGKKDGNYHLAALLSFQRDSNLFIGPDGRWVGNYIPAALRSHPFRLMRRAGGEDMVLCIDEESELVRDADGEEPFFDEEGKPTSSVSQVADFLQQLESSQLATDTAVKALAEAGVIVPWDITIKGSGEEQPLSGFYRVDETKLNGLPNETYLELRKSGAIGIAYGQIISMNRLEVLGRLVEYQGRLAKLQSQAQGKPLPELDQLFVNDDKLMF